LASRVDPGANKKVAKLTAVVSVTNTFGAIAEEYLQRIEDEGAAAPTVMKNRWLLVDLARPELGARPIETATAACKSAASSASLPPRISDRSFAST